MGDCWNPFVSCFGEEHSIEIVRDLQPENEVKKIEEEPIVPPTFGDLYILGEKLGEGGYAVVKKATKRASMDEPAVAVKIVTKKNLKEKDRVALIREFEILKNFKHPNIVHAFDFFEEEEFFYVVMEFLEGGELFDRVVKKTQYNEAEAREVVVLLLNAIKYCHDHDTVHRDLKPENLLLTSVDDDANLKLADFGLALFLEGAESINVTKSGTPDYIAPEVIENKAVGRPIDMWSFGVIMFILLGGYPPFHESSQRVLFAKICKGQFTFHPKRWSNVSDEAKDLIRGLLNVDPSKRLTAEQALSHSWLQRTTQDLENNNLDANLVILKKFNARRKLKGGIKAVMAINAFGRSLSQRSNASVTSMKDEVEKEVEKEVENDAADEQVDEDDDDDFSLEDEEGDENVNAESDLVVEDVVLDEVVQTNILETPTVYPAEEEPVVESVDVVEAPVEIVVVSEDVLVSDVSVVEDPAPPVVDESEESVAVVEVPVVEIPVVIVDAPVADTLVTEGDSSVENVVVSVVNEDEVVALQ